MPKRTERIVSAEEAVSVIEDGDTIGIANIGGSQEPMILIRALLRRNPPPKDLILIGIGAGQGTDMLIGAGLVKRIVFCYMGMQSIRPILYMFRDAVIKGKLEYWEVDFQHMDIHLKCEHWGMPCMYTKAGLGTDIVQCNPKLKEVEIDGEKWIRADPIPVDVALVYVHQSDPYGNCILNTSYISELFVAEAAKKAIIVAAETIIPNEFIRRDPRLVVLGGPVRVDYVVEAPWGAHPCESGGVYVMDEEHVIEYNDAARATITGEDPQAFQKYMDKYVYGPKTQAEYLEAIGGITKLLDLRQSQV